MADLGTGAAITLSTGTFSGTCTDINISAETRAKISSSALATTGFGEYIFADLVDPPEVTIIHDFATGTALPSFSGTTITATITFPLFASQSVAATYAGTGQFISRKFPDLTIDGKQVSQMVFAFDGVTGPTYTAAT